TLLRIEGFGPSVDYRATQLAGLLEKFGAADILDTEASKLLWKEISDCRFFTKHIDRPLWRVSVPPQSGARVIRRILEQAEAKYYFDWAGGLIWLECPDAGNACETIVRGAFADCGGHATLVRANEDVRRSVPVFQPQSGAFAGLSKRLRAGFDPQGVLNPGRMVEGD
ncbi:MAG: hypothetical protein K8F25_17335, partial [Fimbriimonadaceae bacterium]|nr:hypothetical protein [Alphaproteobacteria bacterium]